MTATKKRNPSIDLMRFIGLTMIVLAHIGLPGGSAVFQLRCFDVPLMVFTSGLAFSGKNIGPYFPFIWKRTLRLVVPVYIFVAAYLALNPLLAGWGLAPLYSDERILGSFLLRLQPSMGYVWIIRVFLIVMLMTPLLLKVGKALKQGWTVYLLAGFMLLVQNLLVEWLRPVSSGILIGDWILYILPYSAIFLLGIRFRNAAVKERLIVIAVMAVVMSVMAFDVAGVHGTWLKFQAFKYPPQAYFLLWGMLVSAVLWMTSRWWAPLLDNRLFTFIGRNTIWIYLWHIPFVNMVVGGPFDGWHPVWKYVFVYGAALAVYAVQYRIVELADGRWPNNKVTKYFLG